MLYLPMEACFAGGILGAAITGATGTVMEAYLEPTEGEFLAEHDIHRVLPVLNLVIFVVTFARNAWKTTHGWPATLIEDMRESHPKEPPNALL